MTPTRPLLRYHGGKWRLAPWILAHVAPHRTWVEPFAGAGSVLFRKPRSYSEVLNDLDDSVVNLYRVLRDPPKATELRRLVELTPYCRAEFVECFRPADDAVEHARRTLIRYWFGFGSGAARTPGSTGFRNNAKREGSTPAHDWRGFPDHLANIIERLRGVTIDCEDAFACIKRHDAVQTLFYVDPPYLPATRTAISGRNGRKAMYAHELDDAGHQRLLATLANVKGMVLLSGYDSPMYREQLPTWRVVVKQARGDGACERTECLWINPACDLALLAAPDLNACS